MFTSVIGALTSVLPKNFIFGSYVPVLIFGFVNFALTFFYAAWARHAVGYALTTWPVLTVTVAFVGTVVVAYVVSSINDFLREVLEGRHIWPRRLADALCGSQEKRRNRLEEAYRVARVFRFLLASKVNGWDIRLRAAGSAGANMFANRAQYDPATDPAATALGQLRGMMGKCAPDIPMALMETAVTAMEMALRANDKTADARLESDRIDLMQAIGAVLNVATQAEFESASRLYSFFGTGPVKPTRMGNIAAAIQSYAVGRYKIDLTIFISRLQTVLVKDGDKGYPIVLDAKTQLDFLVVCCWFSALTALGWLIAFMVQGGELVSYLALAVIGPLVTIAFYFFATENYLSYAEVLRACVDINRFALLRATDHALPKSLREERALWSALSRLTFSGGGGIELSYQHADAPPPPAPADAAKGTS